MNASGQVTASSLVAMFQLAQHIKPTPSAIYRLLRSVIDARTQAHAIFQKMASEP